jgi:cation diffusion facilitator family transporter
MGQHRHGHAHRSVDPSILASRRGLWALKWSFAGLMATALLQLGVVWISGSVALLADTVHNFGDAATALPLGVSFFLAGLRPSRRFPYGLGRAEDLAGILIVAIILFSAAVAAYQAVDRLLDPRPIEYLGAVAAASVVGFLGNEAVALLRIRVGREIGSAALVADGHHARVDGLTSLAVLAGAIGVWLGFPLADPVAGLGITLVILTVVWHSGKEVFSRVLDGVEPRLLDEIRNEAARTPDVSAVSDVRARWVGHRLRAELNVAVPADLSVAEAHAIAVEVRHRLLHRLAHLADAVVHVDPEDQPGERHHRVPEHAHDGLAPHGHP